MTTKEEIERAAIEHASDFDRTYFRAKYSFIAGAEYMQSLSTPSPNTSLLDALKELVELKDMKDNIERRIIHDNKRYNLQMQYDSRKPLAWEAARKAISSASGGGE